MLADGQQLPKNKRAFDIFIACLVLLLFLPFLIIIGILIRLKLGSPILFFQERPGKNGVLFKMIKFRTMTDARNENGNLLSDKERLTPFGKFLRACSIDELPELLNVLKGDMSLVGPRPLLVEYLELYNKDQSRRHEVVPGVTGWAQVNGRNAISWEDRFNLDIWYVDHRSFRLDLLILFRTAKKVLIREGINSEGQATMEKFKGTSP